MTKITHTSMMAARRLAYLAHSAALRRASHRLRPHGLPVAAVTAVQSPFSVVHPGTSVVCSQLQLLPAHQLASAVGVRLFSSSTHDFSKLTRPDGAPSRQAYDKADWVCDADGVVAACPGGTEAVNEAAQRLYAKYGVAMCVVVVRQVDGVGTMMLRDYAVDLFNEWGVGTAERNDGVMLFMASEMRRMELVVGSGLEASITDNDAVKLLHDSVVPVLKKHGASESSKAMVAAVDACASLLQRKGYEGPPVPAAIEAGDIDDDDNARGLRGWGGRSSRRRRRRNRSRGGSGSGGSSDTFTTTWNVGVAVTAILFMFVNSVREKQRRQHCNECGRDGVCYRVSRLNYNTLVYRCRKCGHEKHVHEHSSTHHHHHRSSDDDDSSWFSSSGGSSGFSGGSSSGGGGGASW